MVFREHLLLLVIQLGLEMALVHAIEHEACDILHAELAGQVFCPLLGG